MRSNRLEKAMIAEAAGLCAWCRKPEALQVHHIDGDRANTVETNLVALCLTCHEGADHAGRPSPADLHTRKLELLYDRQRTGSPAHAPASMRAPVKKLKFVATHNRAPVQQAERIHNDYRGTKPPPPAPAPDSIGAHAAERGYLGYLRTRYIKCRLTEKKYGDKRRFVPAQASNIFQSVLGGIAPLQAPLSSFDHIWRTLHGLVCGTVGARKYLRGYQPKSWEQYQEALTRGKLSDED